MEMLHFGGTLEHQKAKHNRQPGPTHWELGIHLHAVAFLGLGLHKRHRLCLELGMGTPSGLSFKMIMTCCALMIFVPYFPCMPIVMCGY